MENKTAEGTGISDKLKDITAGALKCMQCGICSSSCPSGRHTSLNIRKIVKTTGKKTDILDSEELWMCTTCYNCQERCPRGITIVDIVLDIRAIAAHNAKILPQHRQVCNMLLEYGHAVPINEDNKRRRTEMGLEELPETVHKYKDGLEEVKSLLISCGFDKLILQSKPNHVEEEA